MIRINIIGDELRKLRKEAKESLLETAAAVNVDRTHLNKIELGDYKPTMKLLDDILAHFSIEGNKANQLRSILREMKEPPVERLVTEGNKERKSVPMSHELQTIPQPNAAQVMVDPAKTQVMYTDSTFVTTSEYGLVLDVAQTMPGGPHQVVARIGMSFDHAKKLLEVISDHLQKHER